MKRQNLLDKYRVIQDIGMGGGGEVFLVGKTEKDNEGNQYEALYAQKIIKYTQQNKEAVKKELLLLNMLNHPHIVKNYQFYDDAEASKCYFIMEYCNGGHLENIINTEKVFQNIMGIIAMITLGVKYLHESKVIHRDLKPYNILLQQGVIKIVDFGISKAAKNQVTVTNNYAGTPLYIAPQNLQSDYYNQKVDIWSLGIIFLQLLTNKLVRTMISGHRLPCDRADFPNRQYMDRITNQQIHNLVNKMLDKNPQTRFSIHQVWQVVKNYYPKFAYKKKDKVLCHFKNGDFYEGKVQKGKKEGRGNYYFKNGNRFEGFFKDGLYHGLGTFYFANGDRYQGNFKDGKENGEGVFFDNYGNIRHQGQFQNGRNSFNKDNQNDEEIYQKINKLLEQQLQNPKQFSSIIQYATKNGWQSIIQWTKQGNSLDNMKELHLVNLNIQDITVLEGLTSLNNLGLKNNLIKDISILSKMTNLTSLGLSKNQIANISALKKLYSLIILYLNNNIIQDISDLEELTSLKTLQLEGNKIVDIFKLSKLTSLNKLCLGSNKISDISPLFELKSLQILELYDNLLSKPEYEKKNRITIQFLQQNGTEIYFQ